MPELPEVEVVRAGLEPAVTDAVIDAVSVYDERSLRRHAGPSEDFIDRLEGRGIRAAVRRGKFLWLPLSEPQPTTDDASAVGAGVAASLRAAHSSSALVIHLGMSGQVLLRDRTQPDDRLTRIRLDIEHPSHGPLRLNFVDQRIFGSMSIVPLQPTPDGAPGGYGDPDASVPAQVAHIARDPLDPAFDDAAFLNALKRRNSSIKRVLLDQGIVSGIGNIYADEALWAARIHFDQPASSLSRPRAKTLLAEVRLVLTKALAEGGTSFDAQYVNVNGASGYFAHSLNAYGQHGKPCPRCGRSIRREQFMNRGSHFCAFCQRLR
jgi:formamidopyrimidine-DNA glycosylase